MPEFGALIGASCRPPTFIQCSLGLLGKGVFYSTLGSAIELDILHAIAVKGICGYTSKHWRSLNLEDKSSS